MNFRTFSAVLWFVSALFVIYGFYVTSVALTGDASGLPLIGPLLSRPHPFDKAAPILILIVFAWVLFEIALKQRHVSRQHAANRKLPITDGRCRSESVSAKGIRPKTTARHPPGRSHHR